MTQFIILAGVVLGSGGVGGIIVKLLSSNVDSADAQQRRASAQKDDVDSLRAIIAEVKEQRAEEKAAASVRIDALEIRLSKLEERERHALTRAAVHEAWDALTFQAMLAQNPNHPPPPPIRWELDHEDAQDSPHN